MIAGGRNYLPQLLQGFWLLLSNQLSPIWFRKRAAPELYQPTMAERSARSVDPARKQLFFYDLCFDSDWLPLCYRIVALTAICHSLKLKYCNSDCEHLPLCVYFSEAEYLKYRPNIELKLIPTLFFCYQEHSWKRMLRLGSVSASSQLELGTRASVSQKVL